MPQYPTLGVADFATGGVDLQPGQTYALIFFAESGHTHIGTAAASSYEGGSAVNLVRNAASASFNDLYSATGSTRAFDLAFGATFSAPGLTAIPEPATAVAGLGLAFVVGLVALRLHQRRRALARGMIASPIPSITAAP